MLSAIESISLTKLTGSVGKYPQIAQEQSPWSWEGTGRSPVEA